MASISKHILETFSVNLDLINDLAKEHSKSHESVKRWIRQAMNDEETPLTAPASLRVIRKRTGLKNSEIMSTN